MWRWEYGTCHSFQYTQQLTFIVTLKKEQHMFTYSVVWFQGKNKYLEIREVKLKKKPTSSSLYLHKRLNGWNICCSAKLVAKSQCERLSLKLREAQEEKFSINEQSAQYSWNYLKQQRPAFLTIFGWYRRNLSNSKFKGIL